MSEKKPTVREALALATKELSKARVPDPKTEAEYLLTHILKSKRHELFLDFGRTLSGEEETSFKAYLERRKKREPAQYITGEVEFRGYQFKVTRATLIPRPETELLVYEAVRAAKAFGKEVIVVDLCTGSGCIAVSVAKEVESCRAYATDISEDALKIAAENAVTNGVAAKIEFLEGDLFTAVPQEIKGRIDLILSNPPYVAEGEIDTLAPEVKDYEPKGALYGGADGLDFLKRIIKTAPEYLSKGGYLIMEIGFGQSKKVREIAAKDGRYGCIDVKKDYSGIDRVFVAKVKA